MPDNEYETQAPLTVTPERLPKNRMLGFRVGFASAELDDGTKISYDEMLSMGSPVLGITVNFPDGTSVQESLKLRDMMSDWAKQIIATKP